MASATRSELAAPRHDTACCTIEGIDQVVVAYATGLIKGVILLPLVVMMHFMTVLFTNIVAFPIWLDHGYAAIR